MSDDVNRLAKFLGMMGSDHDGEVLNAARMAERHRKAMNKSWLALLSPSGGGNEMDYLRSRAQRAETMVFRLEARVIELERELSAMRAARASASAASSSTKPFTGGSGKYNLPRAVEDNLSDALLANWRTSMEVYSLTKWPRAHLRVVLGRIAKRRGYRLDARKMWGNEMQYRFFPLA